MFSTYILFSKSRNQYYTGSTENLVARLARHNRSGFPHTAGGEPWIIVYEKHIKKTGARKFLDFERQQPTMGEKCPEGQKS